jgi:pimeloyl-ACP methyl ester carboxylesterase
LTDPASHGGDPADAFHVVAPSLPGFGFSRPLAGPGWDTRRVARAWAELMDRLGYDRYGAQGGDTGSVVSPELGRIDPEHVIGVHVNNLGTFPSGDPAELTGLTGADRERLALLDKWGRDMSGYAIVQSTRPQTISYALTDSPAGQLAWIVEKFKEWTDPRASLPEDAVSRDLILTDVSVYWLTGTAGSAARIYYGPSHGHRYRPRWRCFPATPPSGPSPSATITWCIGPSSAEAATSPRWKHPISWSATCGNSSASSADPPTRQGLP